MGLGDIRYNYQEKIDNLDNRITRYKEIITDYETKINKAEKEENPNISSVIKSKSNYERKIHNMESVKGYYQEFVDTSDYLMQFLNENDSHMLLRRNEDLSNQLEDLQKKYDLLTDYVEEHSKQVNSLTGKLHRLSIENTSLKANVDYYKPYYNESIQLEEQIEELQMKIHDLKLFNEVTTKKNKNLLAKIKELEKKLNRYVKKKSQKNLNELEKQSKELDELKRRNKMLEDYCNHLLSRTVEVEGK